jgi:quercetin dioxygenase-like cupin family protein
MSVHDVISNIDFSASFKPRILHADEHAKAVLVCLAPGQSIPAHAEDNQAFFYVLEGAGVVLTDEGELRVAAGKLVTVPRGSTRGLRADEAKLVVLATAVLCERRP